MRGRHRQNGKVRFVVRTVQDARQLWPHVEEHGTIEQLLLVRRFIDGKTRRKKLTLMLPPLGQPDAEPNPDLGLPIEELDLGTKINGQLTREGINTIGDLIARTEEDLLDIRNFGQKSVDKVKAALAGIELELKQPVLINV